MNYSNTISLKNLLMFSRLFRFSHLLILLVIFSCPKLPAQILIGKIIIDGNNDIPASEITDLLMINNKIPFDTLQIKLKIDTLKKIFFKKGLFLSDCKFNFIPQSNGKNVDLHLSITGVKNITIAKLEILGDTGKRVSQITQEMENSGFSENKVSEMIDDLLKYYEQTGFPFAIVVIDKMEIVQETDVKVNILFKIIKGERVTIEGFKITGNDITSENIIVNNTGIYKGELYNKLLINKIPERLMKLDVFDAVRTPEIYMSELGGVLGINVKESKALAFDGILGFIPPQNSDEKAVITGLVNISFKNLFGTARKLSVLWQRENKLTQTINLQYVEPQIFSLPVKMDFNFYQREQDSLYVQRNIKISNSLNLNDNLTASMALIYETVIPGSENNSSVFTKSNLYSVGFELLYDTRNNLRIPETGVLFKNYVEVGNKKYSSDNLNIDSKSVKKIGVDVDFYNRIFRSQILLNSFHGKMLISDNIEQTDLYYFGGINSIRGYRENQFMTSSVLWLNNEYRFLFQDNTSIYPFFDLGYFKREKTIDGLPQQEEFLYSYGLGFNINSEIGIIRLNFSLGKDDTFSGMKVHLGFKNNF